VAFWVYILKCADDAYYTGHTDNLELRVARHQAGVIPGFTAMRRPVHLVFSQDLNTREDALAAELQLKPWSRKKKEALIRGDWGALKLAAKKDFGDKG
jgi:predicted GIY-YIG superfamily endonuclease